MPSQVSSLVTVLRKFAGVFTARSYVNFVMLFTGLLLCLRRHSIARAIQVAFAGQRIKNHAALYRLLSAARWSVEAFGRVVFNQLRPHLDDGPVIVTVDDTLMRHSGPQMWGIAMHYDATESTYGRKGRGPISRLRCGLNWVIASVWVPLSWRPHTGIAVPVTLSLYRSPRHCDNDTYRTRPELAVELIERLARWCGDNTRIIVIGDAAYTCRTVLRALPPTVDLVGPLPSDAALWALPPQQAERGRGRPRVRGDRLPSIASMTADDDGWQSVTVNIYSKKVRLEVKHFAALWYGPAGRRPLRIVLTRDPNKRWAPAALMCTRVDASPTDVIEWFARRWSAEVMHRDVKQLLGAEHIQNGWYRRVYRHERRPDDPPGIRSDRKRGRKAAERTVPLVFYTYAIVVLWYLQHGDPAADVARRRLLAPWYRHKQHPSFADMLTAARLELLRGLIPDPMWTQVNKKCPHLLAAIVSSA